MPSSKNKPSLAQRFIAPPFSVFDSRQGYWQDRKSNWLSLGIRSELGRAVKTGGATGGALFKSLSSLPGYYQQKTAVEKRLGRVLSNEEFARDHFDRDACSINTGTSVFDPVLAEIAYSWFCPLSGTVLDPFAGGSVRGVVAGMLGRRYVGMELSAPQIAANQSQAVKICPPVAPDWRQGDARNIAKRCWDVEADFVFSCPPYFDLERYSDDPADLSNMKWGQFMEVYTSIIHDACSRLQPDRFACFVVSEIREKKSGHYRDLIGLTKSAFSSAGLALYNDAVLLNAIGTAPIRSGRMLTMARKLGRVHQNVLVFIKGDARRAVAACGGPAVEIAEWFDGLPSLEKGKVAA